jgi:hypothetical protein
MLDRHGVSGRIDFVTAGVFARAANPTGTNTRRLSEPVKE